jgi:hypothetical protein
MMVVVRAAGGGGGFYFIDKNECHFGYFSAISAHSPRRADTLNFEKSASYL